MTRPRTHTRIFIVDDHPLVREWMASLLRHHPELEIAGQAEDAPQALAAMQASPPDVAIIDLSLKSSSGIDLIKSLHKHIPQTQVIVLSMREEIFDVESAFRAGARGYVTKGEPTSRILEAIREVRAGRLYANPEILARLAERVVSRSAGEGTDPVDALSDRERDVFRRLGEGQGTRRISTELRVSMKTVQEYCARIKAKLGLANASELMRAAVRWVEQHRG